MVGDDVLLSSYSDEPLKGCDDSAGEMDALRGAGDGESDRCDVEHDVEAPESERVERSGEDEGENVVLSLRRGLDDESMRKAGMFDRFAWSLKRCGGIEVECCSVVMSLGIVVASSLVIIYRAYELCPKECR